MPRSDFSHLNCQEHLACVLNSLAPCERPRRLIGLSLASERHVTAEIDETAAVDLTL